MAFSFYFSLRLRAHAWKCDADIASLRPVVTVAVTIVVTPIGAVAVWLFKCTVIRTMSMNIRIRVDPKRVRTVCAAVLCFVWNFFFLGRKLPSIYHSDSHTICNFLRPVQACLSMHQPSCNQPLWKRYDGNSWFFGCSFTRAFECPFSVVQLLLYERGQVKNKREIHSIYGSMCQVVCYL